MTIPPLNGTKLFADSVRRATDSEIDGRGVWPDVIAPAQHTNPAQGWVDPRLPDFREIWRLAREMGYAVGVHGSLKRDCDLIAAPWVEEAVSPEKLAEHLCQGLNAQILGDWEVKPLGRLACTIQIDGWVKHIDLSVCPRTDGASMRHNGPSQPADIPPNPTLPTPGEQP